MLTVSLKEKGFIRYLNMNVEFTKFREFLRLRKLVEFIHPLASSLWCLKFQEISKLIPKIFKWRQKELRVQADSMWTKQTQLLELSILQQGLKLKVRIREISTKIKQLLWICFIKEFTLISKRLQMKKIKRKKKLKWDQEI
jgi:hypothetical protein